MITSGNVQQSIQSALTVGHYQHMCFKTKPSGVNALYGESNDPGESDPDENIFLGALTAEHCLQTIKQLQG